MHNKWNNPFKGFNRNLLCLSFIFSFFILLPSCTGQVKKEQDSALNNNSQLSSDTLNKPKVNVKVNKQYDKEGNIIKYDSAYVYTYKGGNPSISSDSIFNNFKLHFDHQFPSLSDKQSDRIFFNDSLFKYDFFNDDYFQKRFELNQKLFSDFYKQMDSLKRNYLKNTYPDNNFKKGK